MHEEVSILADTTLWYTVALILFVVGLIVAARKPLMAALDGEIAKVRAELDEAKRLRAEAEQTLNDYRQRQAEAMKEAEGIVAEAKALAARLRKESEIELAEMLKRHEQQALDRIHMIQDEAMEDVRATLLSEAMSDVRARLAKAQGSADSAKLIDQIIADLPKLSA